MMETDGFLYFQNMTPRTLIEMYARFFWPVAERGIMKPKSNNQIQNKRYDSWYDFFIFFTYHKQISS